jgi:acylphosphatase
MADAGLHLRIRGRVQGVGYRAALMDEARLRKLRGWVRNRSDGSVEALLIGPRADCDAVAAWARRGPPAARVMQVAVEVVDAAAAAPAGFECRPTE